MSTSRVVATGTSVNTSTKAASLGLTELSEALRFAASNPVSGQALDDPALSWPREDLLTVISYIDVDPAHPRPVQARLYDRCPEVDSIEVRYDSYEVSSGVLGVLERRPASTRILTGALIPATGSEPTSSRIWTPTMRRLTMPAIRAHLGAAPARCRRAGLRQAQIRRRELPGTRWRSRA